MNQLIIETTMKHNQREDMLHTHFDKVTFWKAFKVKPILSICKRNGILSCHLVGFRQDLFHREKKLVND